MLAPWLTEGDPDRPRAGPTTLTQGDGVGGDKASTEHADKASTHHADAASTGHGDTAIADEYADTRRLANDVQLQMAESLLHGAWVARSTVADGGKHAAKKQPDASAAGTAAFEKRLRELLVDLQAKSGVVFDADYCLPHCNSHPHPLPFPHVR